MKGKIKKSVIAVGISFALLGVSENSSAGGFQLFEQNAVNMGDFGAGGAAIAEDASTAFFNPAGLTRICHQQLVLSADTIITDQKFSGVNVWRGNNNPLVPPTFAYREAADNVQGGSANIVPAINYAAPITDRIVFGFTVGVPFGLKTNYAQTSALRYSGTESKLSVLDLSPSLGVQITKPLSIGAGLDIARIDATLDSVGGLPIIPSNPTLFDSVSRNNAMDWGYGWHAGLLYQFNPCTRVGLAYHSALRFNDLKGSSTLIGPLVNLAQFVTTGVPASGIAESNNLRASTTMPPWTNFSIYHDINPCWAIDGSVVYTQWNRFNDVLTLHNVQSVGLSPTTGLPTPVLIDVSLPQHFRNTWRFALGAIYRPLPCLHFRAGVGYDQTPTNNTDRSIRLPDGNRYAVAVGAHYQVVKPLGVDVGWTHLFIQKVNLSSTAVTGGQASTAIGDVKSHADLVGAQLTWDIT